MSRTSTIGGFAMGKQSAKDVAATTVQWMPATSVNLNLTQNVQAIPAEVGGAYFPRGSYKPSVSGGGDVAFEVRPNALTYILYALTGQDTTTSVVGQSGAFQHVFTPFTPAAGVDLPWMTLYKDVAKLYAEQYLNAKLRSVRFDIPKSALVTGQSSWFATIPSSQTIGSLGTETFDSSPVFQSCVATVALTQEGSGSNISANSIKMERFGITLTNNISDDEFSVGSFYADDVTLLQKTAMVDMDLIIRDTALYQAVYQNGSAVPSAWSPTIYRGSLTLTLSSTAVIGTTTQVYQLIFNFPGLDFMTLPIGIAGANLVRATLSSQVTLGPSGADMYTITLINGVSASY